jgi:hypothetical protein
LGPNIKEMKVPLALVALAQAQVSSDAANSLNNLYTVGTYLGTPPQTQPVPSW